MHKKLCTKTSLSKAVCGYLRAAVPFPPAVAALHALLQGCILAVGYAERSVLTAALLCLLRRDAPTASVSSVQLFEKAARPLLSHMLDRSTAEPAFGAREKFTEVCIGDDGDGDAQLSATYDNDSIESVYVW
jgi:hypothetical protein